MTFLRAIFDVVMVFGLNFICISISDEKSQQVKINIQFDEVDGIEWH